MSGPFDGFNIAVSGMQAYQLALNTTGHNIANVGTPGYSKQTVNRRSTTMGGTATVIRGSGVTVTDISVNRREYYDIKYRNTKGLAAEYDTKAYYFRCMDDYLYALDQDDGGVTNAFDDFFARLSTLTDGINDSLRQETVTYGESFTDYTRELAGGLQKLQSEANSEIKTAVDEINAIAKEIALLTKQINTLENYGPRANDLRDQRNLKLDQLSTFVDVEVVEKPPADGVGFNQYMIYINDSLLSNGEYVRELKYEPRNFKKNINDADGLYDLRWDDGDKFYTNNAEYPGTLQAIFTMRDGNNMAALKGDLTSLTTSPEGKQVLELSNTNINDPNILSMPPTDGIISIGGLEYVYESFEVTVGADGKYSYSFTMKKQMTTPQINHINNLIADGITATAGTNVDFKGIPFVMNQLNEFVRTFSENFNNQHKAGFDFEGLPGLEFFNAKDPIGQVNYEFDDQNGFSSVPSSSNADGNVIGSYYHMTCLNFYVSDEIQEDPRKMAMSNSAIAGHGNHENVNELLKIRDMHDMFIHGAPATFLQSVVSVVGVEGANAQSFAKSHEYVCFSVDNRRLEISGTDKDEEAEDMIRFQSLLNNQFKVLSVMNEILDKLINDTGV